MHLIEKLKGLICWNVKSYLYSNETHIGLTALAHSFFFYFFNNIAYWSRELLKIMCLLIMTQNWRLQNWPGWTWWRTYQRSSTTLNMFYIFVLSFKGFIASRALMYLESYRMNLFEMPLHFVPGGFNMADHTFRKLTSRYHSPQICNHFEVMRSFEVISGCTRTYWIFKISYPILKL